MAHTGMFVAPLAGSPPVGMSPTDGRLVMGGLFQVADQLVAGGGYTPSASVMQATVNQAVWSIHDVTNASAVFYSPTDAITLTFAAAPGTGGRIDLVVVKQNNVENGDADSRINVTVVTGVASGSPVAPAVPTGAAKYLQVLINAGVTNMAAATWTNFMQTTFGDPQLQAPTLSALNSVTGVASQLATVTADPTATNNGLYLWTGSAWTALPRPGNVAVTPSSVVGGSVAGATVTLSGAASASLNGVFTSAFSNYRIVINVTTSAAATVAMVLRASGTDSTAANYDHQRLIGIGSTASASQALGAAFWSLGPAGVTLAAYNITIDLFSPALAVATAGSLNSFGWTNPMTSTAGVQQGGMLHRLTSAFDGFTLTPSTGTMSGTVTIYGYNS